MTLKNVPEQLQEQLRRSAKEDGRSMNSYAISQLQGLENEKQRRRSMRERMKDLRAFVASLPTSFPPPEELIREDRGR